MSAEAQMATGEVEMSADEELILRAREAAQAHYYNPWRSDEAAALFRAVDERDALRKRVAELKEQLRIAKWEPAEYGTDERFVEVAPEPPQ